MKYLVLTLFSLLSFISNAQYFSNEFLSADLEHSRFQLAEWDNVTSEKDRIILMKTWNIGSLDIRSSEDTSTYNFVIFPAKYTAKMNYKGIAVCRFEDYKKFQAEEGELCMITADLPVLSMMMIPDKVLLPDVYNKLLMGLKNNLALQIRFPGEEVIHGKANFISFKKSIEQRAPFFHPFALNSSFSDLNAQEFGQLHTSTPQRLTFEGRGQGSIKGDGILIYNVPLPKAWKGASFEICAFNSELGVFYSEPCPRTEEVGRLGEKQLVQMLSALYSDEAVSFFPSKP
jgi:hypothetical protein